MQALRPNSYHVRFALGIFLNSLLVVGQIFYGLQSNSVALISDALHNAGDVLGLLIAWGGYLLWSLKSSQKFTYGLKNSTILAAFANAIILLVAVGGIGWEAIQRMSQPHSLEAKTVIIVAGLGVIINGLTAMLFISGNKDLNIRGAFLHMISDMAISFGVIASSLIILLTGWVWVDAGVSLIICALILFSTLGLFKESIYLMLHAAPSAINVETVKMYLLNQANVNAIHDLHIWAISATETALSVHVVAHIDTSYSLLQNLTQGLKQQFGIEHVTIQIENQRSAQNCQVICD